MELKLKKHPTDSGLEGYQGTCGGYKVEVFPTQGRWMWDISVDGVRPLRDGIVDTFEEAKDAVVKTIEKLGQKFIVKTPCNECPFSRKTKPGTTGGSAPQVYVGQAHGPFWLPCHKHTNYDDPNWKTDLSKPQCAGAAMYRNLVGVDDLMPSELHKLVGDPEKVFSSPVELIAHHEECDIETATTALAITGIDKLVWWEMVKAAGGLDDS